MAHRTILTARQRATLFDLPTDEAGKGWGRRTTRLDGIVRHIGFALGGRPGMLQCKITALVLCLSRADDI